MDDMVRPLSGNVAARNELLWRLCQPEQNQKKIVRIGEEERGRGTDLFQEAFQAMTIAVQCRRAHLNNLWVDEVNEVKLLYALWLPRALLCVAGEEGCWLRLQSEG